MALAVFQPGVAVWMHGLLQAVLFALNGLLGYCAVVGTLRPHFEILFALSLGLTASYAWLLRELALSPLPPAAPASSTAEGETGKAKPE